MEFPHEPVLVEEVVRDLLIRPDGLYVDGTCGSGGHSLPVAEALSKEGRLICLDRDPEAVRRCRVRLSFLGERVAVHRANYADLGILLEERGSGGVDGILLDLGLSTYQLDQSGRGFSFQRSEPLDMRMDPESGVPAAHLVNTLPERELERILKKYGEERKARAIARAIVRARSDEEIMTASRLASLVRSVVPRAHWPGAKDPATRTFQALRIAVNRELENLGLFLDKVPEWIHRGGRLVILSYHSLEDRMVKQAFRAWEKGCTCPPDFPVCTCGKSPLFRPIRRDGLKPTEREIAENPRARSAVLRSAERI
ncbi:MAG: 16S rRNA (cytosine(1402)-N(4))-methyltransferase RsmH [Deltaproteobacteria bacterium]|nr:16S rRNA (cytosine(1402)-N(4))-methyltransferase RsmH [Deltaproteobacteria bacterium]